MRKIFMAAALSAALAMPVTAKPGNGGGHGGGHAGHGRSMTMGGADYGLTRSQAVMQQRAVDVQRQRGFINGCPPGLAKRNNGCVAPGLAKRNLQIGQQLPSGYRYNQVPTELAGTYPMRNGYRYVYNNGSIYEIDAVTRQIVNILTPAR